MGKSLSELNLKEEILPGAGETLADLPQFGQFAPPPKPGAYRFQLPGNLNKIWDLITTDNGERVNAIFDQDAPLLITQSPDGSLNKEPFQTRLSNTKRARGKDKRQISDLDYLVAAIEGPQAKAPKTNAEYIQRVSAYGGKEFGADVRWSWSCNPKKDIRVRKLDGTIEEQIGKKGCGERYYQDSDVKKEPNGEYPEQIQCPACGGVLRAFAGLDNIKA